MLPKAEMKIVLLKIMNSIASVRFDELRFRIEKV